MLDRLKLARNWLPRYTGMPLDRFGDYILLTNFQYYLNQFVSKFGCSMYGEDKPMQAATNDAGLTIINFGIGSVGGVVFGAFLASRARGDFRLEAFDDPKEMIRHLAGAALMGFGGVAALGCTIGQGGTGMSTLSLGAPLALAAIFLGAYLGLKYLVEGSLRAVFRSGFARY